MRPSIWNTASAPTLLEATLASGEPGACFGAAAQHAGSPPHEAVQARDAVAFQHVEHALLLAAHPCARRDAEPLEQLRHGHVQLVGQRDHGGDRYAATYVALAQRSGCGRDVCHVAHVSTPHGDAAPRRP